MGVLAIGELNHRQQTPCIQKSIEFLFFAENLSKISIFCIPSDKGTRPATIMGLDEKNTMDLQYLEFDCSEDTEGVVCWDALAQPAASHTAALLREVTQLLSWASRFSPRGPGPLEDGADWDFDLHLQLHSPKAQRSVPVQYHWQAAQQTLDIRPTPGPDERLELSLSLSGTPGFSQAFREQLGL